MKKMLLALSISMLLGYIFFAGEASTAPSDLQTVRGTVESISIGSDPLAGNKSEIVIIDGQGQQMRFTIRTGIGVTISGREKLTSLKNLSAGDIVIMDYIKNRDGTNKAMTIEIYNYHRR
ncbi:MAG: hypothetical protein NTY34_03230 [Candidatus Omnitrophica bacterium]|nr:hypothetical protein [Candidatus Omnitrophota bacterium]